jgi:hypothetical protein
MNKDFINNYLKKFEVQEITQQEKKKFRSQRSEILDEIYQVYVHCQKLDNWASYRKLYKEDTKENQKKFVASKSYFKAWDIKRFVVRLSYIPTDDLFYILSIARDMKNRKQNFSKWIMWNTKQLKEVAQEKSL